jgi:hypothetical protein
MKTVLKKNYYTLFASILAIVLFVYVVIRSILVEPIHDELATLFHYVDYNKIFGKDTVLDANNHLLNSVLSKVFYSLCGDHIWAIRIPNVLSFLLFFFASYRLSLRLATKWMRFIFLMALTSIPYVLDYFAYSRGYAMSIALLMLAFLPFLSLAKKYNPANMVLMALLLVLAIYANLNLLITSFFMFAYIGVKLLIDVVQTKRYRPLLSYILISILTIAALSYAIWFSFELKNAGALYYGNKDGLWLTTGATLSQMVLMTQSIVLKYVFILVIAFLVVHLVVQLNYLGLKELTIQPAFLFIGLFIANLIAIELMSVLMDTNYPEDRVGMHLIFLFLLSVFFTLDNYAKLGMLAVVFVSLPFVAWKHFNFISSVFSPDDRMEKADFIRFIDEVKDNYSSSIYLTQHLSYAYHVRKHNPTNFFVPDIKYSGDALFEDVAGNKGDFVQRQPEYKELIHNPRTSFRLFVKKTPEDWKKSTIMQLDHSFPVQTKDMYFNLIDTNWKNSTADWLKIVITTSVKTPFLARESLVLVVDKVDNEDKNTYRSFNLNWASGKHKEYTFTRVIDIQPKQLKHLSVYLFNPNEFDFTVVKSELSTFER